VSNYISLEGLGGGCVSGSVVNYAGTHSPPHGRQNKDGIQSESTWWIFRFVCVARVEVKWAGLVLPAELINVLR